ncbi:uncharacterized protein EV154DRAFT_480162 [Mucor mucedo]|uniref:uncharacterized protein n=1 Tax=Mucor mucedo TaxID=29922 RepID=UPI002220DA60|nr:uncharacterized protein EV154DRAFT_480162 [Mucor mucedo]KAI7892670.1 hypothetical protein EV154DRAFT_480162 [Mucor mucedo]
MDIGREFSNQERHKGWDDCLYQELKEQRMIKFFNTAKFINYSYVRTANKMNTAALDTNHRIKRGKIQKEGKTEAPISLKRKRVTRKIRTKRYHKKNCSRYRSGMFKSHELDAREGSVLTFVGYWSRNGTYVGGHGWRSLEIVLQRFKFDEKGE